MDIELIMVIKSFCIVAGSIEVSFSGKTFICFGCMRRVSLTHEPHKWAPHLWDSCVLPICGSHVSVRHMFHTPDAWDTIFIERDWECDFFYENFAGRIYSLYQFYPFLGIVVLFYFVQTCRVPYIQFPNYIQTLVLKIWKLHW